MGQESHSATGQIWTMARRALLWARGCVSTLAEDIAAASRQTPGARARIVADEAGMEAFDARGRSLGRDPARFSTGLGSGGALLRIGAGKAVVKRITLPEGARDVLAAVVRNKVEGLAPWPLPQSLWGHRLAEGAEAGQIAVDVGIVSRRAADGLTAALAASGIKVTMLEIGDGIAVDFRGPERARAIRRRLKRGLAGAALAALASASYGGFLAWSSHGELAAVAARTADVKRVLLGGTAAAGEPRLQAANALLERKKTEAPVIAILKHLTELVPDTAWLEKIDVDHGRLLIIGHGADTSGIVERLETSAAFAGVSFAAATQRDAETGADAFSISAMIEGAGAKP